MKLAPPEMVTDVGCPYCLAFPEEPCETSSGKRLGRVHVLRTRLYCRRIGRKSPR